MLKLLINITTSADAQNFSNSTFDQLLRLTIANTSAPYAICGSIIVMCMFATTLRNLIYKVLNLAVLSVFVVALWAYLTDVTFIYVVYILTFVSAVVMLFLSVVLMLPSSAIAVTKRNFLFVLSTASASTSETSIASITGNITTGIVCLCLTLLAVYLVLAYFKSWKLRQSCKALGHPSIITVLEPAEPKNAFEACYSPYTSYAYRDAKKFSNSYYFYIYGKASVNKKAIWNCNNTKPADMDFNLADYRAARTTFCIEYGHPVIQSDRFLKNRLENLNFKYGMGSGALSVMGEVPAFEVIDTFYPKYIRAVPRLLSDIVPNGLHDRRALLMIPYEFINFYVHRLEPSAFLESPRYMAATARLREFANATDDRIEFHCYRDGGRSPIAFNLRANPSKVIYLSIYTPWWSPFRLFGPKTSRNRMERAAYRFAAWLNDRYYHKGKTSHHADKINATPVLNGYIPPAVINIILKNLKDLFNFLRSIPTSVCLVYHSFRLHPALVVKLAVNKNADLCNTYALSDIYYMAINFVFSYVELPLSSKTGNSSGFRIFREFYDLVVPAYSLAIPEVVRPVKPAQYATGNAQTNKVTFIRNFSMFVAVNLFFNLLNAAVCAVIFLSSPTTIELATQAVTTLSIFFIAIPVGLAGSWALFTYSFYLIDAGASGFAENLAAIQQGLYVNQPLLLLVSITGLLVALIGAPFFVSKSK